MTPASRVSVTQAELLIARAVGTPERILRAEHRHDIAREEYERETGTGIRVTVSGHGYVSAVSA